MAKNESDTALIDDEPIASEESPVEEDTDESREKADNGEDEGDVEDGKEEEDGDEDLIEDEDEGDGKDAGSLALDPKVAKELPPEIRKRYEQQAAGLNKLRTKLEGEEKLLGSYREWDGLLSNKASAANATRTLVGNVLQAHGLKMVDVFPDLAPKAKADGEEDAPTFEFDTDKQVYEKAKADALKEMDAKLRGSGMDPETMAQMKAFMESTKTGAEKAKAEREKAERIDSLAPRILKTLKAKNDGWSPSPDAIKKALASGDLSTDGKALESVRMALYKDLLAHTAKKARTEPGMERLRGSRSAGRDLPKDPMQIKASDFVRP